MSIYHVHNRSICKEHFKLYTYPTHLILNPMLFVFYVDLLKHGDKYLAKTNPWSCFCDHLFIISNLGEMWSTCCFCLVGKIKSILQYSYLEGLICKRRIYRTYADNCAAWAYHSRIAKSTYIQVYVICNKNGSQEHCL